MDSEGTEVTQNKEGGPIKGPQTERMRRRVPSTVVIQRFVIGTSIICTLVNCVVIVISASTGRWLFGPVCCQLFGWLSQCLVASSAWMITLFTLERCCFYTMPTEHASILSEINTKLLICGVDLLLVVLHTAPLYGWGEYSEYRGGLQFHLETPGAISSTSTNVLETLDSHQAWLNNSNISLSPMYNKHDADELDLNIVIMYIQAIQAVVGIHYGCVIRTTSVPVISAFIRCPTLVSFDKLLYSYANGELGEIIGFQIDDLLRKRNISGELDHVVLVIHEDDSFNYKNTFLSIQDVGTCTLDWSAMNQAVTSWITIIILSSTCVPYLVSIIGAIILLKSSSFVESRDYILPTTVCSLAGSILGLLSTLYFYISGIFILNGKFVNRTYYLTGTVLYYMNSVWFSLIFIVSRRLCPQK